MKYLIRGEFHKMIEPKIEMGLPQIEGQFHRHSMVKSLTMMEAGEVVSMRLLIHLKPRLQL